MTHQARTPAVTDRLLQAMRLILLIILAKMLFVGCAAVSSLTPWPLIVMIVSTSGMLAVVIIARRWRRRALSGVPHEETEVLEHESGESLLEALRHPLQELSIAEAAGVIA
ncbi:MAG: hypothetical protein GY946_30780 [bacterium]|nr:hypothetical protein [bacterium]